MPSTPKARHRLFGRWALRVALTLCGPGLLPHAAMGAAPHPWVQDGGEVSYTVVHKFHRVQGVSKHFVVAVQQSDTGLKIMVRAPISSFDSGNQNRDAHVLEVVEAAHFPDVTVRGISAAKALPAPPQVMSLPLSLEVELHGVKIRHEVVAQVKVIDATHVRVSFAFDTSLTAHRIERPSLLFVAVDDALHVAGDISLHAE